VSVELNPALLRPGTAAPSRPVGAQPGEAHPSRSDGSFAALLKQATTPGGRTLRFSKHALERIERRGIAVDGATLGRLEDGVARVSGKGARESLVLVDGTAFVVSVDSRTVITAVGSEHMREHVFTNIDSAAIA